MLAAVRNAGYATGILTDCTSEVVELWPSLPYASVVDAVTFSCEVGQRKPHPAGYRDIADKLRLHPAECLYVGDGSSDELRGAAAVGMAPILIDTPLDESFRFDAKSWSGTYINNLHEMQALLRELEDGVFDPTSGRPRRKP